MHLSVQGKLGLWVLAELFLFVHGVNDVRLCLKLGCQTVARANCFSSVVAPPEAMVTDD